MLLAIAIVIVQQVTFFSYIIETALFARPASEKTYALVFAVALLTTFLSVPSLFWNIIMVKEGKKRDIVGVILSIVAFVFGVTYLVIDFINRVHGMGGRVF